VHEREKAQRAPIDPVHGIVTGIALGLALLQPSREGSFAGKGSVAGNVSPQLLMTADFQPERRRGARGIKPSDRTEPAVERHRAGKRRRCWVDQRSNRET